MGERLSRLAPTIIVGVAALLLAACGDADTGNVPSVSPSPSPRTTVATTVTTRPRFSRQRESPPRY